MGGVFKVCSILNILYIISTSHDYKYTFIRTEVEHTSNADGRGDERS